MYLPNYLLILSDQIRPIVLVPLDPIFPHLNDLFPIELPGNAKSGNGVVVGIEMLLLFEVLVILPEKLKDVFLVGLDLRVLAVCHTDRVARRFHSTLRIKCLN